MSELLWVALALLPSLVVFFVLLRLLGKRIGDTVQWVSDARTRLDRLELELTQLAAKVGSQKPDPRIDRLSKQLSQFASDIQSERTAFEERIKALETEIAAQSNKLSQLTTAPQKIQQVEAESQNLFSSPVVQVVVDLLSKQVALPDIARQTGLQVGEVDLIRGLKFFAGKGKGKA